jgi:serine/threonine protein kinase
VEPKRKPALFDLPGGTRLGKYEILRKLAVGGMAEIYLARMTGTAGFEKLVVIKRILPTVANDPKFVQMFLDEARLAATLQHPNIADVYEVGEHEDSPFFAMEFIHGQDVRSIRIAARDRKERIPLAIALAIVHGTASALDYAHDRCGLDGKNLGLVHRDVSSSNILVSYEGAIKLIDFGIARASASSHKTQTGTLKGKIPYMAPEQCRGMPLDRRSDLFSLGIVLYELTVGRRPFRGENDFAIMDQIVHSDAPPPSDTTRNYPPELEAIVMRMLARRPEHRYQSAEEMLHDLDPFLQQHRLWVSPKPLSKYMRTVFADRIDAIDRALEDGVTLSQHLASIQSSESAASVMLTPPSGFPPVVPLSQEMPAVRPSTDLPFAAPEAQPAPELAVESPSKPIEYPKIKRSGAKVAFGIVGALALGAGGYVAFTVVQRDAQSTLAPPPEPAPAPAPSPAAAVAPAPKPADPVTETKPPEYAPAENAPAETKPAEPKPVEVAKPEPKPPVPPPKAVKRPAIKRSKVMTQTETETKESPAPKEPPKEPKEQKPKETPKDQEWNLDSPFLPPAK